MHKMPSKLNWTFWQWYTSMKKIEQKLVEFRNQTNFLNNHNYWTKSKNQYQSQKKLNLVRVPDTEHYHNFPVKQFVVDCSSPIYICSDIHVFKTFNKIETSILSLGKCFRHKCAKKGNVEIIFGHFSAGTFKVTLTDVYYVSNAFYYIVSLYKLQNNNTLDILVTNLKFKIDYSWFSETLFGIQTLNKNAFLKSTETNTITWDIGKMTTTPNTCPVLNVST